MAGRTGSTLRHKPAHGALTDRFGVPPQPVAASLIRALLLLRWLATIVDNVGNHSLLEYRRVLNRNGVFVIVGGPSTDNQWIGALTVPLKALILSPFVSQKFEPFLAELNKNDLNLLRDLMEAGKVTPVIDRQYSLSELPPAMGYLQQGHARGKIVIRVAPPAPDSRPAPSG